MEKKLKISSTAYRVLLLLQKLNEKGQNVDELNNIFLKDPDVARFFSKDVILKYISTLRTAGYSISKPVASKNYCYKLNKAPAQINFSNEEIKTLAILGIYAQGLQQNKFVKHYFSFIEKLKRYMSEEQVQKLNEQFAFTQKKSSRILNSFAEYSELIKKIEQYISENQKVEIKYLPHGEKQENLSITKLQKIKYEAKSVSVIYYDLVSNQMNSVKISELRNLKQLPSISEDKQTLCPVIFKLKGRLAKVYRPYEGEKVSELDKNIAEITVTAYSDDIDALLTRLLKYGEHCEILYPRQVRSKMIKLITTALRNYQDIVVLDTSD